MFAGFPCCIIANSHLVTDYSERSASFVAGRIMPQSFVGGVY
ncbi:MAG: hypothetical protein E7J78_25165 [Pantoea sp.]|jgi:hypothetical protein|nr:hypothetical protein [Pantoea sp.]